MNDLLPPNPTPLLVAIFFVLPFLSFYAFWRLRRSESIHWLKWNSVPELPLTSWEILSVSLLVGLGMKLSAIYLFLPLLSFTCATFLTLNHGTNIKRQWGLDAARFPTFFRYSFNSYFALLLPVTLVSVFSAMLCGALGYTDMEQPAVKKLMESHDPKETAAFVLLAVFFAPIWEEMIFRGILYPWLKSKTSRNMSLLLSAVIFAAIHQHVPSFLPLVLLGLCLALAYEYTGSLFSSIVLHAIFNFATCLNLLMMRQP